MIRAAFRIRKQCWCSMQKNRGGKFIRFTVMMIILVQTGGGRQQGQEIASGVQLQHGGRRTAQVRYYPLQNTVTFYP